MEPEYIVVCPAEEIAEGQREVFSVNDRWIAIFKVSGRYYAVEDLCTHDGNTLTEDARGNPVPLEDYELECPRHGARFDIRDGSVKAPPALVRLPIFPIRVHEGNIEIALH